jgi:hypothetical protein
MQAQTPPTPPVPPTPPTPPAPPAFPGASSPQSPDQVVVGGDPASPADVYQGLRAQRRELQHQLESLEEKRSDLSGQLQEQDVSGADRAGLERRVSDLDQRIATTDQQIAATDAEVARAAGLPGATVEPTPPREPLHPDDLVGPGLAFSAVLLLPLVIAYARRIWRRGAAAVAALPAELVERLGRLEQAVDSIAFEVERIGEGQRFMARFFSENGAPRPVGAGPAQPVEVRAHEAPSEVRR